MHKQNFIIVMEQIVNALVERGYNPYSQIYGYIKEGDSTYITNYKDARKRIEKLDIKDIRWYIEKYLRSP